MSGNPEADVLAAIDELERDSIDDLVDWQMSASPAARVEHSGASWVDHLVAYMSAAPSYHYVLRDGDDEWPSDQYPPGSAAGRRVVILGTGGGGECVGINGRGGYVGSWGDQNRELGEPWATAAPSYGAQVQRVHDLTAPRRLLRAMDRIRDALRELGVWTE